MSELNLETEVAGSYTMQKFRMGADGALAPSSEPITFENIVTDVGLVFIANNTSYMQYAYVGAGSAAPQPTDTQLGSFLMQNSSVPMDTSPFFNTSEGFAGNRRTFRFNPRGSMYNASEVGVGMVRTELFSRALVRDALGNPATISVLADEYLDVTYEIRLYPPLTDSVVELVPNGSDQVPRTITCRACHANSRKLNANTGYGWDLRNSIFSWGTTVGGGECSMMASPANSGIRLYTGDLGTAFGHPSGTFTYVSAALTARAATGGAYGYWTVNLGLSQGNGELSVIGINMGAGSFQIKIDPPFQKTAEDVFELVLKHSWGRK